MTKQEKAKLRKIKKELEKAKKDSLPSLGISSKKSK